MRGSERDFSASFLCYKKWENVPFSLILCDFNGILTGQNIEKNGSLNIINKVQTEWSVIKSVKRLSDGANEFARSLNHLTDRAHEYFGADKIRMGTAVARVHSTEQPIL